MEMDDANNYIDTYLAALDTPYEHMRKAAILSLEWSGTPRIEKIIDRLLNDPTEGVRWTAAQALEKLIPVNKEVFKKTDVQDYVGIIKTTFDSPPVISLYDFAVSALITALTDNNSKVREHAAQALRQIKDIRALEKLIDTVLYDTAWSIKSSYYEQFRDNTHEVRYAAMDAILVTTSANLNTVIQNTDLVNKIYATASKVISSKSNELKEVINKPTQDRANETLAMIKRAQIKMGGSMSSPGDLLKKKGAQKQDKSVKNLI